MGRSTEYDCRLRRLKKMRLTACYRALTQPLSAAVACVPPAISMWLQPSCTEYFARWCCFLVRGYAPYARCMYSYAKVGTHSSNMGEVLSLGRLPAAFRPRTAARRGTAYCIMKKGLLCEALEMLIRSGDCMNNGNPVTKGSNTTRSIITVPSPPLIHTHIGMLIC